MKIEKLTYTNGEKTAEIASGIAAAGGIAGLLIMVSLGRIDGDNVIIALCVGISYAVLTLCSVCPQHANLFTHPEKISEKRLRIARRVCIIAKIVVCAAFCVFPIIGIEIHN